jgi:hypothetical protein
MRRWLCSIAGSVGILFLAQAAFGAGSEMEILLKKLQEKGVLTPAEANEIAKETKQAAAAEKAAEKAEAAKEAKALELPEWIKNTKVKGDLRLRYENRDRENDGRGSQGRERYRVRVSAETKVADGVSAGFGLASGTGDQRSQNQTMGGDWTSKDVWINLAYAKYAPTNWLSFIGGKFNNPIWQPNEMLISNQVNPEGGALQFQRKMSDDLMLGFNGGMFVIEDRSSGKPSQPDPIAYAFQPEATYSFTKNTSLKFAPAYYVYSHIKNTTIIATGDPYIGQGFSSSGTNTAVNGKYKYNYSAIAWGAEFDWDHPFGFSFIPRLAILGGYLENPDPSENNKAYLAGVVVGNPSVNKPWDWSVEYTFRRLEKDSTLDFLPNSSFYGGNTNVMGHRVRLLFGLLKNTSLGLNYYYAWKVRNFSPANSLTLAKGSARGDSSPQNLFQADLMFKF